MTTLRSEITQQALPNLPFQTRLDHIPGSKGQPFVGHTFLQLRDPYGFTQTMARSYGPIYRLRAFGMTQLSLLGPEANELVLLNQNQVFSSDLGWNPTLNLLFPNGLMMLDFEVHRTHRRLMNHAFKPDVMQTYVSGLNQGISANMAEWGTGKTIRLYDKLKALTLELAAMPFLGIHFGKQAEALNAAFAAMVKASVAPVRRPYPFTAMRKGVQARAFLCDFFAREIPQRRGSDARDMFTILCNAVDEDGTYYEDQEIIDHMTFLMMAAHDTITSSATSLAYELGRNRDWQTALRDEIAQTSKGREALAYDDLPQLELTQMAFKEALRLHPPVPTMPRRAIKDFEFGGYDVPAGTFVSINPLYTHRMEAHWPNPMRFDPNRFTPDAVAARHKYAWVPFGGGAHMCLGLHFAYMQAKLIFTQLLTRYEITLEEAYQPPWQPWPIYKPKDGLPLRLNAI
jgi:cytochrome P450